MAGGRRWRRVLEGVVVLAMGYFVGAYLVRHAAEVRGYAWTFDAAPLAGATALAAAALLGYSVLWARLLQASGQAVPVRRVLPIWFLANLARYAPGKIWQFSGLGYLARRRGLRAFSAIGASVLLQMLVLATGALLVGALLPRALARTYGWAAEATLVGGALVAGAVFLSPLFDRLAAALARRLGRPGAETRLALRWKLVFGGGAALAWLVYGLGFWLFLEGSVGRTPPPAAACGIFIAGYLAGFLAFFAPGGLGVREGVYVLLLQPYLPSPVALAAAVLSRLWLTLIEIVLAVATLLAAGRAEPAAASGGSPPEGPDRG